MLKQMLAACKEILGPPPCKYAILGLGPFATEECTPYSDIELAVLIEEEKSNEEVLVYFKNLIRQVLLKERKSGVFLQQFKDLRHIWVHMPSTMGGAQMC